MRIERDYLLGTHDEEIARLGLQHRVWRPRVLDAWRRAGFTVGQTIVDVGCGPGYASVDLAEIVGAGGRVVAIDRSRRFLDTVEALREQRGLDVIQTLELDLDDADALPAFDADGAWCRWVFAFLTRPRALLERIRDTLAPGGRLVVYEYLDYSTWRLAPALPEMDEFVRLVMKIWREAGGEPDIGGHLPVWLQELGFRIAELRPIVDVVPPSSYIWRWPSDFIEVNLQRLADLGHLTAERADAIRSAFAAAEARPHTLMVTPTVLEIIAVRE